MTKLPAPLALKRYIIEYANEHGWDYNGPLETEDQLDEAMVLMHDQIGCDSEQEIMQGDWETDIQADYSRYCETKSVAVKDNAGNFIGFTKYYGGGKHFDSYAWYDTSIENAYYLTCEEKEVLTIQRTWAKVNA